MGIEIERKFLVKSDDWRNSASSTRYCQGYLANEKERTLRVRTAGNKGFITIKGTTTHASRSEFEYEIPLADAEFMLANLCQQPLIEKIRHLISYADLTWEVDEFLGENAGLVVAEVELTSENQTVKLPCWAGKEVTGDPRYYNANLVSNPFSRWK